MKSVFLNEKLHQRWNKFVQNNDDVWFWHTIEYMEYTLEYSHGRFAENQSFFIEENAEIQAVCPVIIEKNITEKQGDCQFSYGQGPMPAIAVRNNLKQPSRKKIIEFYLEELKRIARQKGVNFVSIRIPALAKSFLAADLPIANPFVKFGYIDLPYQTQLIDLRNSYERLWSDIRKGHKANIKEAADIVKINVWDTRDITIDKFRQYQNLHRKAAGRVTRSQKTFDLMYSWVKNGLAALAEAEFDGRPVGFTLVILYKKSAYYGSSCRETDYDNVSVSHLIQWKTMKYLKNNGMHFYDMGLQDYCPQWFRFPSQKDINISKFKRGFGGVSVPLITSEYYFSKELMRKRFLERLNRNYELDFKEG